jgi:hypothetical protein
VDGDVEKNEDNDQENEVVPYKLQELSKETILISKTYIFF